MAGKSMQTKVLPMSKYRLKPDIGSGDEVTKTLLEITPLARQGFQELVNRHDLLEPVDIERESRHARAAERQEEEIPGNIIMTQPSIEIIPTETEGNPKKRVRVKDLIQIPTKAKTTTTRQSTRKVPSWHLTSQEVLKFIKDSHDRTQEEERKEQEKVKITKEALKKARATKKTGKK